MHAVKHSGAGSDLETMSSEVSDHCDDVMTTSDAVLNEVVWSESRDLIADRRAGDRRTSDRRIYSTAVRFMAEDHIEHIGELRNISAPAAYSLKVRLCPPAMTSSLSMLKSLGGLREVLFE